MEEFSQKDVICTGGQGTSARSTPTRYGEEGWHEGTTKTTIRAENEVEAQREANNYKVGQDFNSLLKRCEKDVPALLVRLNSLLSY